MTRSVFSDAILPLPRLLVEPVVRAALLEDLGRAGDITTDAIVPPGERMRGVIASRQDGVISGTDAAAIAFALVDPAVTVTVERGDGPASPRATWCCTSRGRPAPSSPPSASP